MIKDNVLETLNDQLTYEVFSAYTYKAMAAYFEHLDLKGFANFMNVQTMEELTHAEKFYRYLTEAGARVLFGAVDQPGFEFDSPLEAFKTALRHEQRVSERMAKLSDLAIAESDHATRIFLEWFVTEQVEEEASFSAVISKLKMVGDDGRGLLLLDQELAQRVFVLPADLAQP